MRIAVAQLNTVVGDIPGNLDRIRGALERSRQAGATITLVPELAVCGYPPEDLLLRPEFAADTRHAVQELARDVTDGVAIVGFVDWQDDCYNAAAVLADGRVQAVYHKRFLPNYGVFDEARYFQAGDEQLVIEVQGARVGIVICEDIWYSAPVAGDLAVARLDLICCISASPYHQGKGVARERMLATRAADCAAALAFCNLVGGQDELVFDGHSAVFDATGEVVARCDQLTEDFVIAEIEVGAAARRRLREPLVRRISEARAPAALPIHLHVAAPTAEVSINVIAPLTDPLEELWRALVLGIRDYVDKNGFPGVLIGLSGGIDSALTAALAVDALGVDRVTGVAMPSVYSSPQSLGGCHGPERPVGDRLADHPDRTGGHGIRDGAGRRVRRPTAGRRRREPAGARARDTVDGVVQQARRDGAGHRQQERDRRGLQHALRRHGRGVRADSRRRKDHGVRPRALA